MSKKRYYILFIYGIVSIFTTMLRANVVQMTSIIEEQYDLEGISKGINQFISSTVFIPGCIAATVLFNRFGLKVGIVIGAILQAIGSIVKVFVNSSYLFVLIGQGLCGVSIPFILIAPAMLATNWFEESKRIPAISFGGVSSIFGIDLSWFIGEQFLQSNRDSDQFQSHLQVFFFTLAVISVFLCIIVLITFEEEPDSPPSVNASVARDDDLIGTLRAIITNCEFLKLTCSYTLNYTCLVGVALNNHLIAKHYEIGENKEDMTNYLKVSCGFVGAVIGAIHLYKTNHYKAQNVGINFITCLSLSIILFAYEFDIVALVLVGSGFFGTGIYTASTLIFAYSSEVAYPIKETTLAGFFLLIAQMIGSVLGNILRFLLADDNIDPKLIFFVGIASSFLATIFAIWMRPIDRRKISIIRTQMNNTDLRSISFNSDFDN